MNLQSLHDKRINVLGTIYTIKTDKELKDADGLCDWSNKTIELCKTLSIKDDDKWHNMQAYIRKTLIHELMHAFFFESGMTTVYNFPHKEETVDWFAMQFDKIKEAIDFADAYSEV